MRTIGLCALAIAMMADLAGCAPPAWPPYAAYYAPPSYPPAPTRPRPRRPPEAPSEWINPEPAR